MALPLRYHKWQKVQEGSGLAAKDGSTPLNFEISNGFSCKTLCGHKFHGGRVSIIVFSLFFWIDGLDIVLLPWCWAYLNYDDIPGAVNNSDKLDAGSHWTVAHFPLTTRQGSWYILVTPCCRFFFLVLIWRGNIRWTMHCGTYKQCWSTIVYSSSLFLWN